MPDKEITLRLLADGTQVGAHITKALGHEECEL